MRFGSWLVKSANTSSWFSQLAKDAARDPRFPRDANPEQVREYLGKNDAPSEHFEMLDDAEMVWRRDSGADQIAA